MIKPERRLFRTEKGYYVESEAGEVRDCFPIQLNGSRVNMLNDLRRHHGFEIVMGRHDDLDLDYLISGRPDGRFTDDQVRQVNENFSDILGGPEEGS